METLTYGRKKPEAGDKGSTFFAALEDNIDRDDAHNHDGTNSPKIPSTSVEATSATILAASWVDLGSSTYRQLVSVPSGMDFDKCEISFRITNGSDAGARIYPSVVKVSSTTYYVYVNDNTLELKAVYTT
jgi:hypothetical protein